MKFNTILNICNILSQDNKRIITTSLSVYEDLENFYKDNIIKKVKYPVPRFVIHNNSTVMYSSPKAVRGRTYDLLIVDNSKLTAVQKTSLMGVIMNNPNGIIYSE